MSEPVVSVQDFSKRYGAFTAVDGINFAAERGEIFGLLGPNGAGKTSTLECLEGIRSADGGSLNILGVDPGRDPRRLRNLIGVQLQTSGLPANMTCEEAMRFFCAYHGAPPRFELLDRLGLSEKRRSQNHQLSMGQQRRLALSLAVAHNPPLVILDEPTAGLDVGSRSILHEMNYLFPLGFYAMMGVIMVQINPGFKDLLIPGLIVVSVMVATILGLPGPLVESREAGIYRSYKVNGVPAASILVIPALTTIFHALIVSLIIALTAAPFFDAATPSSWGNLLWLTLLCAFSFGSLGALIGVVSANARATVLWSQLIFLPSMLIGGLMMPINMLPEGVRAYSGLLPTTYAMQAMLGLAFGYETVFDPALSAAVTAVGGVFALLLAIYLFNWDSQNRARKATPLLALLVLLPYLAGVFLAL
ncbi:MAG: ABC transporter ATP-binding protein/permease [Chloroflexi bacterium]|nr:ABC transporter ATP-binding protein/permease [Chloroflexota bacterium]